MPGIYINRILLFTRLRCRKDYRVTDHASMLAGLVWDAFEPNVVAQLEI